MACQHHTRIEQDIKDMESKMAIMNDKVVKIETQRDSALWFVGIVFSVVQIGIALLFKVL